MNIKKPVGQPVKLDKAKMRSFRLTDSDYIKFKDLGSTQWLRKMIALHHEIKDKTGT